MKEKFPCWYGIQEREIAESLIDYGYSFPERYEDIELELHIQKLDKISAKSKQRELSKISLSSSSINMLSNLSTKIVFSHKRNNEES